MAKKKTPKRSTAKKQTRVAQDTTTARGRMRARRAAEKATADSTAAAAVSDKTQLASLNAEIQGMVSSGAAKVRPGKLRELQDQAAPIAARMRARRKKT